MTRYFLSAEYWTFVQLINFLMDKLSILLKTKNCDYFFLFIVFRHPEMVHNIKSHFFLRWSCPSTATGEWGASQQPPVLQRTRVPRRLRTTWVIGDKTSRAPFVYKHQSKKLLTMDDISFWEVPHHHTHDHHHHQQQQQEQVPRYARQSTAKNAGRCPKSTVQPFRWTSLSRLLSPFLPIIWFDNPTVVTGEEVRHHLQTRVPPCQPRGMPSRSFFLTSNYCFVIINSQIS